MSRRKRFDPLPDLNHIDPEQGLADWHAEGAELVNWWQQESEESLDQLPEWDEKEEADENLLYEALDQIGQFHFSLSILQTALVDLGYRARHQVRAICEACGQPVEFYFNGNGIACADIHHLEIGGKVCPGFCQPVIGPVFSEIPHGFCQGECRSYRPLRLAPEPHQPAVIHPHTFGQGLCSGSNLLPA